MMIIMAVTATIVAYNSDISTKSYVPKMQANKKLDAKQDVFGYFFG